MAVAICRHRGHRAAGVDMAGTGTIPQFADRIISGRALGFQVTAGTVIVGVAASAVRLVGSVRPGHGLAVAGVAAGAGEPRAVIAGIIGRRMLIGRKGPAGDRVTCIALHRCHEMVGRFAGGRGAVMAA